MPSPLPSPAAPPVPVPDGYLLRVVARVNTPSPRGSRESLAIACGAGTVNFGRSVSNVNTGMGTAEAGGNIVGNGGSPSPLPPEGLGNGSGNASMVASMVCWPSSPAQNLNVPKNATTARLNVTATSAGAFFRAFDSHFAANPRARVLRTKALRDGQRLAAAYAPP